MNASLLKIKPAAKTRTERTAARILAAGQGLRELNYGSLTEVSDYHTIESRTAKPVE